MKLALGARIIEGGQLPIEEFLNLVADAGYEGVDLRLGQIPSDREKRKDFINHIREKGLEVSYLVGGSVSNEDSLNGFKEHVSLALELRTELLLITPSDPAWGRKCCDYLDKEGIKLRLFSQMHAGPHFSSFDRSVKALEEINRDNFGISLDPGNLFILDQDYSYENLKKVAHHIFTVHFQNIRVYSEDYLGEVFEFQGKKFQRCLIGDPHGADLEKFFGNLKKIDYDGWVTLIEPPSKILSTYEMARLCYEKLSPYL